MIHDLFNSNIFDLIIIEVHVYLCVILVTQTHRTVEQSVMKLLNKSFFSAILQIELFFGARVTMTNEILVLFD